MPNQKCSKIIILIALVGIFCGIWRFFYWRVNHQVPDVIERKYEENQEFTYQNVTFTIKDFAVMQHKEFVDTFDIDEGKIDVYMDGEEKDAVFTLFARNDTSTPVEVNILELMLLETNGWSGYTDLLGLFREMNPTQNGILQLKPEEDIEVLIPYTLYDYSFTKESFEKLETMPFSVVLSLYPVKTIVELQKD